MTKLENFKESFLKGKFLKLDYDLVLGKKKKPISNCEWHCISALIAQSLLQKDDTVQICDDFLCAQAQISPYALNQCKRTLKEREFFDYSVKPLGNGTLCSTYALNKNKILEFKNTYNEKK